MSYARCLIQDVTYTMSRTRCNIQNVTNKIRVLPITTSTQKALWKQYSPVHATRNYNHIYRYFTNQLLIIIIDKHATPSLRKDVTHNSSPWFESIRDELFMAKRERRQAERKLRNTKSTIFKDLYGQAKHKDQRLVHTAKCRYYTERVALESSSNELHQVVNTLSSRHPLKILPTIYPSADLFSLFIRHSTNKVEKLRANNSSEHVTLASVTGITATTFSSLKIVSLLTVKECILNSAP